MAAVRGQNIVSVQLSPEAKTELDTVTDDLGMTIKMAMGKLIKWFNALDRTERAIVMGLVEPHDHKSLAELVLARQGAAKAKKSATRPLASATQPGS